MGKKWTYEILLVGVLILGSVIFFYKLGASSLVSWDEAWYGQISKEILASKNFINLTFNHKPYYDHPPLGFWLIALSEKIFGVNEFGVRAASALTGLATLVVIYFLGAELFHKSVGVSSALAIISSPWFALRSRSGNLDIFLTFFVVLTVLLAVKTRKHRRYAIPLLISFSLLLLTKTGAPLTIIPTLLYLVPGLWTYFIFGFAPLIIWFLFQFFHPAQFNIFQKYFTIGLPQVGIHTDYLKNILLTKTYVSNGIGIWFRPAILTLPLGLFLSSAFFPLTIFLTTFLIPFAFSAKGQIWHLIPAHPFLILTFTGFIYTLLSKFKARAFAPAVTLTLSLLLALPQISRNWREFINIPAYVSDEAILSTEASYYPYRLIVDGDFIPAAAFYANKVVSKAESKLLENFTSSSSFLLITHQWRLDQEKILPEQYKIIKSDRDMILVMSLPKQDIPLNKNIQKLLRPKIILQIIRLATPAHSGTFCTPPPPLVLIQTMWAEPA